MAYKVKKPCRVCGKLYTPCSDCENDNVAFHWRTVACSYECGMEYFRRIEESRKNKVVEKSEVKQNTIDIDSVENDNSVKVEKSKNTTRKKKFLQRK